MQPEPEFVSSAILKSKSISENDRQRYGYMIIYKSFLDITVKKPVNIS
jgi:hypothetical protein